MSVRFLVAGIAALFSSSALNAEEPAKTIVVTARSLKDTAADLAACLARKCPPDEDIKATLAHAENQFVQGDYRSARTSLVKSAGRNRDDAKEFPVPVSDLLRANARLAAHLGEGDAYRLSVLDSRSALKSGLAEGDPRILAANIEVGEMRARLGYRDEAARMFKDIAEDASKRGLDRIKWAAQLRQALLLNDSSSAHDTKQGQSILTQLSETPGENAAGLRLAAKVLLARTGRKSGDAAATQALITEYAKSGGTLRPNMLFAPPIDLSASQRRRGTGNVLSQMATQNFEKQWIDIGFWINTDGRVQDAEILRKSGNEEAWSKAVVASVGGRIYAPLKRDPGDPGVYAVERYTYTSLMEDRSGSRINQRSASGRVERIDLTPDQALEGG